MQAAANRLPRADGRGRSDKMGASPRSQSADGAALLHALPIAAAIFTMDNGKLWVEAMNVRFLELAGCHGTSDAFTETFTKYANGEGGAFTRSFLLDPAAAPDEIEIAEGEGVGAGILLRKAARA